MAKLVPVDAYIRVSRVGSREGDRFLSPKLQRESIKRVAEREGLQVVQWFEELDASGGDNARPKWNDAIRRVERGETRGIVCWNLSRFSRSVKDALTAIERIEAAGGKLYSEEGSVTKLDRGLRLLIAEDERDRAKAGFRNAVANAIARGVYIAARIPFGYTRDPETRSLLPDPATSPILVQLFELRSTGKSWAEISRWAKENHGLTLARETLRAMIMNPAYLGHARQGDIVNDRAHPALVSRRLWDAAHKAKGRKPIHTGASKNLLLRGIVTCANCGHKMVVGSTRGKVVERRSGGWKQAKREKIPAYYCRNLACDQRAYAKAEDVDEFVVSYVLGPPAYGRIVGKAESPDPSQIAEAQKEYDDAQYQLDVFKDNRKAIVTLGVDSWNELLEEYVVARDVAQVALENLQNNDSQYEPEELPDLWDEWTTESRKEFLLKVVTKCELERYRGEHHTMDQRLDLDITFSGAPVEYHITEAEEAEQRGDDFHDWGPE